MTYFQCSKQNSPTALICKLQTTNPNCFANFNTSLGFWECSGRSSYYYYRLLGILNWIKCAVWSILYIFYRLTEWYYYLFVVSFVGLSLSEHLRCNSLDRMIWLRPKIICHKRMDDLNLDLIGLRIYLSTYMYAYRWKSVKSFNISPQYSHYSSNLDIIYEHKNIKRMRIITFQHFSIEVVAGIDRELKK